PARAPVPSSRGAHHMSNVRKPRPATRGIPRRQFLGWGAAGAAVLGAPALLAACGGDDGGNGAQPSGGNGAQPSGGNGQVDVPSTVADLIKLGGIYSATVNPLFRIGGSANHAFGDPLVWVAPGQEP